MPVGFYRSELWNFKPSIFALYILPFLPSYMHKLQAVNTKYVKLTVVLSVSASRSRLLLVIALAEKNLCCAWSQVGHERCVFLHSSPEGAKVSVHFQGSPYVHLFAVAPDIFFFPIFGALHFGELL